MQWGTTPPLRMQGDVTPPLHSGRGSMPPSRAWRLLATIAHIEMEEQCTTTSGLEAARHHHSFGERQHATVESLEGPRHHRPHEHQRHGVGTSPSHAQGRDYIIITDLELQQAATILVSTHTSHGGAHS